MNTNGRTPPLELPTTDLVLREVRALRAAVDALPERLDAVVQDREWKLMEDWEGTPDVDSLGLWRAAGLASLGEFARLIRRMREAQQELALAEAGGAVSGELAGLVADLENRVDAAISWLVRETDLVPESTSEPEED